MLNGFKETIFKTFLLLNLAYKIHIATTVQESMLCIVGVEFTCLNRYLGQEIYS